MADGHSPVPPPEERSVICRDGNTHKDNCQDWISGDNPWPCNAHHILPCTCFNLDYVTSIEVRDYIYRCLWVSKWNINGGKRHDKTSGGPGKNNMVRLPLMRAYTEAYPAQPNTLFRKTVYPDKECAHNSRYSEHHIYIDEVKDYLTQHIWKNLKENAAEHKGEGADILGQLKAAADHFRSQLVDRASNRKGGTLKGWNSRKTDADWALPFSMAASIGAGPHCTKNPPYDTKFG